MLPVMRGVLLVLLAGCADQGSSGVLGPPGFDPGGTWRGCESDATCPTGEVCARIGGCTPAADVRAAHVTWTISGMPASAATCSGVAALTISFDASTSGGGSFAPVPCNEGKFSIDKIGVRFNRVGLGRSAQSEGWQHATLDSVTGEAALDLPF